MKQLIEKIEGILADKSNPLPDYPRKRLAEIIINLKEPETYESAITGSRKITEWYLRETYARYMGEDSSRLGYMKTDTLLQNLAKTIPPGQQGFLRLLQSLQNYFSHAQSDTSDISSTTVQGCLLLVLGLVESYEAHPADSQKETQKPPSRILSKDCRPLVLGVDVGTNKIAAGLISFADRGRPKLVAKTRVFHREIESAIGILEKIENVSNCLLQDWGLRLSDISGIGVGLPGQVDYRTGLLKFAPGLKLRNIPVSTRLASRMSIPVFAENDVNCSTLAELRWGAGKNFANFICLSVGTGIGAGLVFDRNIYRGVGLAAGEIGHMKVDCNSDARLCTCGSRGCFEEYASARAVIRMAREAIFEARDRNVASVLADVSPDSVTPGNVVSAIKQHDPLGIDLAERIASALAVGVSNIANFLNPEAIVLGGGIINGFYGFDFFNGLLAAKFRELTLEVCANTSILSSTFGDDSPVFGAASLVPLDV